MKPNGNLRKAADAIGPEEPLQKAAKLIPVKKNGKEKQALYRNLESEDDEDYDFKSLHRRESALDYYDDEASEGIDTEDEWEEMDEDDADDLEEDWAADWSDETEE